MSRALNGLLAVLVLILAGCGHGYEGEYRSIAGSSNEFLDVFAGIVESQVVEIGSDFIESQGRRTEFEDIFVRESGGERYLVFKDGASEDVWKIADDDTLVQGNELINIKLVRVK